MAEEEKASEEAKQEGGGKKKLIIIIVAVVVLIAVGVGAFLAMSGSKKSGGDDEDAEEEVVSPKKKAAAPAILPLETFIVNLQVKGSFLKTSIQLEFTEPVVPPTVEQDMPKIRDAVIRVLSSKLAADILTVDGKDNLREEVRDAINDVLRAEDVANVYFTEFIIQ